MAITSPSLASLEVLRALKLHHNVLLAGPPASGKSFLLGEVADLFRAGLSLPIHEPSSPVYLPEGEMLAAADWLPSPTKTTRSVFQTTFHQGSKYRDFLRGLIPQVNSDSSKFVVSRGILYRAALAGLDPTGAALLIIDEVNRGPAVQVFGESIVALESDKRLGPDNTETATTQSFELLDDSGEFVQFALPYSLYVLAAMNQADTSVEPLDVAFLRRFETIRLEPDLRVLLEFFDVEDGVDLPVTPTEPRHVYAAAIRAWREINRRLALGRGSEYRIGHGVFLGQAASPPQTSVGDALDYVKSPWNRITSHAAEVYFGHTRGLAAVLGQQVVESMFAGEIVVSLVPGSEDIYDQLRLAGTLEDA